MPMLVESCETLRAQSLCGPWEASRNALRDKGQRIKYMLNLLNDTDE